MPSWRWRWFTALLGLCLVCCSRSEAIREPAAAQAKVALPSASLAPVAPLPEKSRDPFAFDPRFFRKKTRQKPGEWLAEHRERGRTFREFVRESALRPSAGA